MHLYNTLSHALEEFKPITPGMVLMYNCGPTVYNYAHIGNLSSYLMADLLRRYLEYRGFKVRQVMNITDVGHLVNDQNSGEDKMEKAARAQKLTPLDVARRFEEAFHADRRKLRILDAEAYPRATEWVKAQIDMVKNLLEKGFAYHTSDGIYFDVQKFQNYGQLSGNKLSDLEAGARVEVNPEKHHPFDFALWKKCVGENADHYMRWDFNTGALFPPPGQEMQDFAAPPFKGELSSTSAPADEARLRGSGWAEASARPGFPGWHIECSAMSMSLLAPHIDIHTGGEDNIFPHHECEIAQSESFTGHKFCNYWIHKRHIFVDGIKMSKSKGNFFTLSDIEEKGYKPVEYRYLILSTHYRQNTNFTFKGLDDARKSIERLQSFLEAAQNASDSGPSLNIAKTREDFESALDDDLNTSAALAAVFDLVKEGNKSIESGGIKNRLDVLHFLRDFDSVFAVLNWQVPEDLDEEIKILIGKRNDARTKGDFATSDQIRGDLKKKGIELLDEKGGTRWKRI